MKKFGALFLTATMVLSSVQMPVMANEISATDYVVIEETEQTTESIDAEDVDNDNNSEEVDSNENVSVDESDQKDDNNDIERSEEIKETIISQEEEETKEILSDDEKEIIVEEENVSLYDGEITMTVADANAITDKTTDITVDLPSDFEVEYTVDIDGATIDSAAKTITLPTTTVPGVHTLTAKDNGGKYENVTAKFTVSNYILVNIPYADFYKSDIRNNVDVDVFTSATKSKAANAGLAGNTYHKADNSEITGVTFPVLTNTVEGLNGVTSEEDLLTAESSSYAAVLTAVPAVYKEYSNGYYGILQGTDLACANATVELTTKSNYGDYQLNIEGILTSTDREGKVTSQGRVSKDAKIYGVIVSTEKNDYGMRGLENIWKSQLAWCTGFTTTVHNCPSSSAHYESMMGQTIQSITYVTSEGIVKAEGLNIYVPIKSTESSVSVANAHISDGKAAITESYPDGFEPEYSVAGLTDATVAEGYITFPSTTEPGSYTLTVTDKKGVYADATANFQIISDVLPAKYNAEKKSLEAADGVSEEDFKAYVNKITAVSVDGKNYNKNGMRGQAGTIIVKTEEESFGQIDSSLSLFSEEKVYAISIAVTGFDTLEFNLLTRNQELADTTALQKKFEDAGKLKEADYTANSWKSFKAEYDETADLLKKTDLKQSEADEQLSHLSQAMNGLVKKSAQTITTSQASYKKVYGQKAFALAAKTNGKGKLTYKTSNSKVAVVSTNGTVTIKGAGTAKITITANGTDAYKATSKTVTLSVAKASQPLKLKVTAKTFKVKKIKKKAAKFNIGAYGAAGKVTYTSSSKKVTVNSKGLVTVKKGTKKGKYKITVKAYGNANYNAGTKLVTITVK